jgi:hypothetical protein
MFSRPTLAKYALRSLLSIVVAMSAGGAVAQTEQESLHVSPLAVQKPRFGQGPFADAMNAAARNNQCTAFLTTNQLAAMMLSVTWPEDTGNSTALTPSPMTLGRADTSTYLYYQNSVNGANRRAFWHAGVGIWQLDDSGLGTNIGEGRFDAAASSAIVAAEVSRRYCSSKSFDTAVGPWAACKRTPGICQQIYNTLLSLPLQNIDQDSSTTSLGGAQSRTCIRAGAAGSFPCYYVNPANAQGYTGSWRGGADNTPPLSWPFYVYTETNGSTKYEWRHWLSTDSTGTSPTNIAARRTYGADSRSGLQWSITPLCDITAQRGACTLLTIRTAGTGSGSVSSQPSGISCGSTCSATFATTSIVTLIASPSNGNTATWTGCDSTSGAVCTVTMSGNRTPTVTFTATQPQSHTLQVYRSGSGSGTVTSNTGGINCGSTCSVTYVHGAPVTLTASAGSGSVPAGWTGCDSVSGNTCTVTMNANRSVTATFSAAPPPPRERLTNGNFSSGSSGWTRIGDFWSGTNLSNYRSAPGYAAGGVDSSGSPKNSAVGSMYQTVAVPGNASSANLSLWLNVTSEDMSQYASDFMNVTLQDNSGRYLATVCSVSNLHRRTDPRDYYWSCGLNLLPWRGQTVRINFLATTNASLKTTFRIDDVSVIADGN